MSNLTLYQVSSQYVQALDFLTDPEQNLPIEAVNGTLEALTGELEEKAINVAMCLKNMETTAEAIKNAETEMAKRRKALEKRVQWLKDYLKDNMLHTGISKIECPYFKLAIQNNPPSVNLIDEAAIPEKFKEKVITWKIDKPAIKEAIQSGEVVPGATLTNGKRLAIR